MLGAIIGDIVGSVYEFNNIKTKDFPLFSDNSHVTDDTIMTLAIYDILKHSSLDEKDIVKGIKEWGRMYPNVGYGHRFYQFLLSDEYESYNSYGNGSAMRVSACGYLGRSKEEVKKYSNLVTRCTHSHPDALLGAEVVSLCIYYARHNKTKDFIKKYVSKYYDLNYCYDNLVKNYTFDVTCKGSVPVAIYCFLISNDFIDCLRTTVSIGGDTDTLCAIACSIAYPFYKVHDGNLIKEVIKRIPEGKAKDTFMEIIEEEK